MAEKETRNRGRELARAIGGSMSMIGSDCMIAGVGVSLAEKVVPGGKLVKACCYVATVAAEVLASGPMFEQGANIGEVVYDTGRGLVHFAKGFFTKADPKPEKAEA